MKPAIFTTLTIAIAIWPLTLIADASGRGNASFPSISGYVIEVTDESEMVFANFKPPQNNLRNLPVREFGLNISPASLEILTIGRRIDCDIYYETKDHIVGGCHIRIDDPQVEEKKLLWTKWMNSSLSIVARDASLGTIECSSEDREALVETENPFLKMFKCK